MKKKKINLYKYVLKPKNDGSGRTYFYGIYHDRGKMVATDGHLLCAIKAEYPENYERKVVDECGEIISTTFPKWRTVIPKTSKVNLLELGVGYYKLNIKKALNESKKTYHQVLVCICGSDGQAYYDAKEFSKFIDFLIARPDAKVYYTSHDRALKAAEKNGDICLIMPRDRRKYSDDYVMVVNPPEPPDIKPKQDGLPIGSRVEISTGN